MAVESAKKSALKKRGRPTTTGRGGAKGSQILLRVSAEERALLDKTAAKEKRTTASWVRTVAVEEAERLKEETKEQKEASAAVASEIKNKKRKGDA